VYQSELKQRRKEKRRRREDEFKLYRAKNLVSTGKRSAYQFNTTEILAGNFGRRKTVELGEKLGRNTQI